MITFQISYIGVSGVVEFTSFEVAPADLLSWFSFKLYEGSLAPQVTAKLDSDRLCKQIGVDCGTTYSVYLDAPEPTRDAAAVALFQAAQQVCRDHNRDRDIRIGHAHLLWSHAQARLDRLALIAAAPVPGSSVDSADAATAALWWSHGRSCLDVAAKKAAYDEALAVPDAQPHFIRIRSYFERKHL